MDFIDLEINNLNRWYMKSLKQLADFCEKEAITADKRYKIMLRNMQSGLDEIGGVDAMADLAANAQHQKHLRIFFNKIVERYNFDAAHEDGSGFVAFCLGMVAAEFSETKCKAKSKARQLLLDKLSTVLAEMV